MKRTLSILQDLSFQDHLYLLPHLILMAALCMNWLGVTVSPWHMQSLDWNEVI